MSPGFYGSIVGLRPEFETQYRVLHRHVFPGVLDRIARSNIRNYSIYLHDNILFAHLEHVGDDYAADQAAIAADETTREWWKLTDPMQVPLDERSPGDWWATLRVVHSRESKVDSPNRRSQSESESPCQSRRHALMATVPAVLPRDLCAALDRAADVEVLRLFRSRDRLYVYVECADEALGAVKEAVEQGLALTTPLGEIEEVFHTDGCARQPPAASRKPPGGRSSSAAASTCCTAGTSRSCRRRPSTASSTSALVRTRPSTASRAATRSTPRTSGAT